LTDYITTITYRAGAQLRPRIFLRTAIYRFRLHRYLFKFQTASCQESIIVVNSQQPTFNNHEECNRNCYYAIASELTRFSNCANSIPSPLFGVPKILGNWPVSARTCLTSRLDTSTRFLLFRMALTAAIPTP
jgi:hypothetical protein